MCVETAIHNECETHVNCDSSDCVALKNPQTLEEYKEALDHWMNHNYLSGCSHGD